MCSIQMTASNAMSTCIAVGFLLIMCLVRTGLAIECYRCNSTSLDCLEKFMYPNPLRAESCGDVFEAQYCIKTTGIYEGVLGTRRFCSNNDMGNKCDFIKHDGDQKEYKGCVYTCNSNGCNDAPSTHRPWSLLSATVAAVALAVVSSSRLMFSAHT